MRKIKAARSPLGALALCFHPGTSLLQYKGTLTPASPLPSGPAARSLPRPQNDARIKFILEGVQQSPSDACSPRRLDRLPFEYRIRCSDVEPVCCGCHARTFFFVSDYTVLRIPLKGVRSAYDRTLPPPPPLPGSRRKQMCGSGFVESFFIP